MDMMVFDSNHRKWGTYERFIVILGNKLYLSRHCEDADDVQSMAEKNELPFIWQRFSDLTNLAPKCVRDQEPRYNDYVPGFHHTFFYEFNINKVPYDWEWQAEKYLKENSQETHSKEYHEWLNDRAVYYNNGFYEWDEKHHPIKDRWINKPIRDSKGCAEIIRKSCKALYTGLMHEGTDGGTRDGSCTVIERNGEYIAFGTGGEIYYSDDMSFTMFWRENTLEELVNKLERSNYKLTPTAEDATESFVKHVKRYNPKDFVL